MIPLPPVTHFEEQLPIWEIREDESSLWYERFTFFLALGPSRSIMKSYRSYNEANNIVDPKSYAPQKWYSSVKKYRWVERARVYDQYQRAVAQRADEEARDDARKMRRELLDVTKAKLLNAINEWEPEVDAMDWVTIRSTLTTLLELSRSEFGDTEPDKSLGVNIHANGAAAFEKSIENVYAE